MKVLEELKKNEGEELGEKKNRSEFSEEMLNSCGRREEKVTACK